MEEVVTRRICMLFCFWSIRISLGNAFGLPSNSSKPLLVQFELMKVDQDGFLVKWSETLRITLLVHFHLFKQDQKRVFEPFENGPKAGFDHMIIKFEEKFELTSIFWTGPKIGPPRSSKFRNFEFPKFKWWEGRKITTAS